MINLNMEKISKSINEKDEDAIMLFGTALPLLEYDYNNNTHPVAPRWIMEKFGDIK